MRFVFCLLLLAAASWAQNPVGRMLVCSAASGSGTAYTCNLAVAPSAYVAGTTYRFQADVANTGSATINISSLGAKTIQKFSSGSLTNLSAGDIAAGQWVSLTYDGTVMQMGGATSSVGGTIPNTSNLLTGGASNTAVDSTIAPANVPLLNGKNTFTANAAASSPAIGLTGSIFTGGSGSTTVPYFYVNQGTAPTTWSTSGTEIGISAPSGFTGNFLDFHLGGGGSLFAVNQGGSVVSAGNVTVGPANSFIVSGKSRILSPTDGILELTNGAVSSFTRLQLGGTTSSFPALKVNGTALNVRLADDSADAGLTAGTLSVSDVLSSTANASASTSAIGLTGSLFTGGSGTTTVPYFYINQGTAPTTWSTGGTLFGLNAPSGFAGNFLDLRVNGGPAMLSINPSGSVTVGGAIIVTSGSTIGAGSAYIWSGRSTVKSPADGTVELTNGAGTSFSRLQFGGTTASFPALNVNGTALEAKLADNSAFTKLGVSALYGGSAAPTISVSGSGCTGSYTAATGSGNLGGDITVPSVTGCTAAVVTLTWSGSLTYTNNSVCSDLVNLTQNTAAHVASKTATSCVWQPIALTTGDNLQYFAFGR